MIYRIKQFFWAINCNIKNNEVEFLNNNLNKLELQLFSKLSKSEQKHCLRVAYDVKKTCQTLNINDKLIIKAALLHDIGKIYKKLNIVNKSCMVLANALFKNKMKKFEYIKSVNVYYNHPILGYEILKKISNDEKLLFLIKNHHNRHIKGNLYLDILMDCDDRN